MENLAAGFADGREIANAYGQTADHYFYAPFFPPQNNEDSLEASAPEATLVAPTSVPNQDRAAKRERDKAYREREKKRKMEMMGKTEALTQENKALKDENRALKAENTHLNQALQSNAMEIGKLKHDLNQLVHKHKTQVVLVNTLSEKLASFDDNLGEKNQQLQNENDLLREGMGMDNLSLQLIIEENAKLQQELVKVKHEQKALKVQLGAVCEKFIAENSSP